MANGRDPAIPEIGPTWTGFCDSTQDAMFLFEACLQGRLPHIPRRPQDREKDGIIKSGAIFIYEENASGIKRWTDGKNWSPSRILGNYLLYREVNDNVDPKDKKKAKKNRKGKQEGDDTGGSSPSSRRSSADFMTGSGLNDSSSAAPAVQPLTGQTNADRDIERNLIGSLTDTYAFKQGGLIKKTASVRINGVQHHLVSYYTLEEAKAGLLKRPSDDPELNQLDLRSELLTFNWRAPFADSREVVFSHQSWGPIYNGQVNGVTGYMMPQTYPAGQQMSQYQPTVPQQFPVYPQQQPQNTPRYPQSHSATRHPSISRSNRPTRFEPYPSPALSLSRTSSLPTSSEHQISPVTPASIDTFSHRRPSLMPQMVDTQHNLSPVVVSAAMDHATRPIMIQRASEPQYLPTTTAGLESVSHQSPVSTTRTSDEHFSPVTTTTAANDFNYGSFTATTSSNIKNDDFASQYQDQVRQDSAFAPYTANTALRSGAFKTEGFQQSGHDSYNSYYDRSGIPEWQHYDTAQTYAGRAAI